MARAQRQRRAPPAIAWRCVRPPGRRAHGRRGCAHLAGGQARPRTQALQGGHAGVGERDLAAVGRGLLQRGGGVLVQHGGGKARFCQRDGQRQARWPGAHDEYVAVHVHERVCHWRKKEQALWAGVCGRALQCIKGARKNAVVRVHTVHPQSVTYVTQRDVTDGSFPPNPPIWCYKRRRVAHHRRKIRTVAIAWGWEVVWHGCMEQWRAVLTTTSHRTTVSAPCHDHRGRGSARGGAYFNEGINMKKMTYIALACALALTGCVTTEGGSASGLSAVASALNTTGALGLGRLQDGKPGWRGGGCVQGRDGLGTRNSSRWRCSTAPMATAPKSWRRPTTNTPSAWSA